MSDPLFSIVVPTRHRAARLRRLLQDLRSQTGVTYEVVVVDNTDGDPAVRRVVQEAGARYVLEPRVGLNRARNAGALAGRGTFVAFTDDDAVPRPDWLRRHLHVLAREPAPAATTGRVLPAPADTPAALAYKASGAEDLGPTPFRIDRSQPQWFTRAHFGGVGVGPNLVFRRDLFGDGLRFREALGPPDGLRGEEHYALFEVLDRGHQIAYVPDAIVDHDVLPTMEAVVLRHRRILRGATAYALMLLVEGHGRRRELLGYLLRAARQPRQQWRGAVLAPIPKWQKLRAAAAGPWLYLVWRMRWRGFLDR